jgi:hypothetical protein
MLQYYNDASQCMRTCVLVCNSSLNNIQKHQQKESTEKETAAMQESSIIANL